MSLKKIKIFLASSSELEADRRELEIAIKRKNDRLIDANIYIELIVWEDFIDVVSKSRLQDEYNKSILQSDLFVLLFFTKVGKYTFEEFTTAHDQFLKTGSPQIITYFKDAPITTGSLNQADAESLFKFQKKLQDIGHFKTEYKTVGDLKFHLFDQLDKLGINAAAAPTTQSPSTASPERITPVSTPPPEKTVPEATTTPSLQDIRDIIARGELEKALSMLKDHPMSNDKSVQTDLIMLTSRCNANKKQQRMGVITHNQFSQENNRITFFLLEVIDTIENS